MVADPLMRADCTYGDRPAPVAGAAGVPAWPPVAGFYRYRLRSGSVIGGVRIWYGPPLDPETGEELDRGWRWQAQFDGEPVDLDRVWPTGAGNPITEAEYRALVARRAWARKNAPQSAYANVGRKIDPLSIHEPLPF